MVLAKTPSMRLLLIAIGDWNVWSFVGDTGINGCRVLALMAWSKLGRLTGQHNYASRVRIELSKVVIGGPSWIETGQVSQKDRHTLTKAWSDDVGCTKSKKYLIR